MCIPFPLLIPISLYPYLPYPIIYCLLPYPSTPNILLEQYPQYTFFLSIYNIQLMFVKPQQQLPEICRQIQSEIGDHKNDYQFLRGVWNFRKNYKLTNQDSTDIEDQMDSLSKVVGMIKQRINYSIKKQIYYQQVSAPDELTIRETKAIESMSKAIMQCQQYRTRLVDLQTANDKLQKSNEQLREENHQLKIGQKQIQKKMQKLATEKAQLENKYLNADLQQSKSVASKRSRSHKKQSEVEMLELPSNMQNKIKGIVSDRQIYQQIKFNRSNKRYSEIGNPNNQSFISISSYGFDLQQEEEKDTGKDTDTEKQNQKQNIPDATTKRTVQHNSYREAMQSPGKHLFTYEKNRNLLREKSMKKNRLQAYTNSAILEGGEVNKHVNSKFVRQTSRKAIIRASELMDNSERNNRIQRK